MNRPLQLRNRRPARGFTLVELLVVIGIIALLISILLPTLNQARRSAKSVVCQSNLRQAGTGLLMFTESNKQKLPTADVPSGGGTGHPFWYDRVMEYLGAKSDALGSGIYDPENYAEFFTCPDAAVEGGFLHYAPHTRLMPPQAPWLPEAIAQPFSVIAGRKVMDSYKLTQVPSSVRTLVLSDASQFLGNGDPGLDHLKGNAFYSLTAMNSFSIYWNQFQQPIAIDGVDVNGGSPVRLKMGSTGNQDTSTWFEADVRFRHRDNDTANVLFLDGHVEALRLTPDSPLWADSLPDGGQLLQRNVMLIPEEDI